LCCRCCVSAGSLTKLSSIGPSVSAKHCSSLAGELNAPIPEDLPVVSDMLLQAYVAATAFSSDHQGSKQGPCQVDLSYLAVMIGSKVGQMRSRAASARRITVGSYKAGVRVTSSRYRLLKVRFSISESPPHGRAAKI
jgi:hypothetical protein